MAADSSRERTSLANERTTLAYVRTAIAFAAFGLFLWKFFEGPWTQLLAVSFIFLGIFSLLQALFYFP